MSEQTKRTPWLKYTLVCGAFALATMLVAGLALNIAERKIEARQTVFKLVEIDETTTDPAVWGKNFPRQYDGYIRTADNQRTRFGGSEAMPLGDGHVSKAVQKLDTDPRLRTIFNGYAFAIDYRERRGHAFMLTDQQETERVHKKKQPGSCIQCHSSNTVAYRTVGLQKGAPGVLTDPLLSETGWAQMQRGFEAVCAMPFDEATKLTSHPVGCLECHDPKTMQLRVTRPGFITGIQALARSTAPTPHLPSIEQWRKGDRRREFDPNVDASRQELRSMACGQCHVEYYFKGEGKVVTYPWYNGLKAEEIEKYYDDVQWTDWTHADSGAKALKAQHPEFELWSQGIHARSGVSCADCHMPYTREGAIKVSDHQVRSPLLNIARSCQTCHPYAESEIASRVAVIQDRNKALLDRAEDAVVALIGDIKAAMGAGASDAELAKARGLQRSAQWRVDFINAENSMGFHAPQECARIMGEAIDFARQGQLAVAKIGRKAAVIEATPNSVDAGNAGMAAAGK